MMKETKIQFSDAEQDLLNNAEIILTKNKSLEKVGLLLAAVNELQTAYINDHLSQTSHGIFTTPGKISKGENYLGLPYLVLDYPRNFANNNIFAVRTMFWWGRFFSVTLHLSGEHLHLKHEIKKQFSFLKEQGFFIGIHQNQWQHHFEASNYKPVEQLNQKAFETVLEELPHIKIAAKRPLNNWHLAASDLFETWKKLLFITGLVS